jgi:hypothetical protein
MALTDDAKKALAELKLAPAKANSIAGFLEVYWTPRTNEDKEQAYRAMLKVVSAATLNPALKKYGRGYVPPPKPTGAKALAAMGVTGADVTKMLHLAEDYKIVKGKLAKDVIRHDMEKIAKKYVRASNIQAQLKGAGLI